MELIKNNNADLDINEAIKAIRQFHNKSMQDENARYLSWVHCYNAFSDRKDDKSVENIDYLSLQLGFYLASWGMMRGSTFLLQKDYKIHYEVVKEILKEEYKILRNITAEKMLKDNNIEKIIILSNNIKDIYKKKKPIKEKIVKTNGKETKEPVKIEASDTLVSKILLGTLGCTPAYDRYYRKTVSKYNISTQHFNEESLTKIAEFYISNQAVFNPLLEELKGNTGIKYTQMKLMDMCMWQLAMNK